MSAIEIPATGAARRSPRRVQPRVVGAAGALLLGGAGWLGAQYGFRHAGLFLVGAGCGLVLYHSFFGFTTAFRVFVTAGDGRGLRAQMLMLAVAPPLFPPIRAAGELSGAAVGGAVAPAGVSVLGGAYASPAASIGAKRS